MGTGEAPMRWQIWINRSGTFTDVVARGPDGRLRTAKLLSESSDYDDAAVAAIRRLTNAGEGPVSLHAGRPALIRGFGADPVPIAAIGMLAGFCGRLARPMAANFNLVPAALLDLKNRYGVIRAQLPTALPLLGFNMVLLWWC
jgi:hypothetical protein